MTQLDAEVRRFVKLASWALAIAWATFAIQLYIFVSPNLSHSFNGIQLFFSFLVGFYFARRSKDLLRAGRQQSSNPEDLESGIVSESQLDYRRLTLRFFSGENEGYIVLIAATVVSICGLVLGGILLAFPTPNDINLVLLTAIFFVTVVTSASVAPLCFLVRSRGKRIRALLTASDPP